MEKILTEIITRLEGNAPSLGLSYIDEEYGQVEFLDDESRDTYPVTFPAVLIDCQGGQWSQLGQSMQNGSATIAVNIYIDCYDDTHAHSTTIEKVKGRLALVRSVTELLQEWQPLDNSGKLIRQATAFQTMNHGIKMYQTTYSVRLCESFNKTGKAVVGTVTLKGGLTHAE